MTKVVVWHGPEDELQRLGHIVNDNCSCPDKANQRPGQRCPAHQIMVDQEVMNHLAYGLSLNARFVYEEWHLRERES